MTAYRDTIEDMLKDVYGDGIENLQNMEHDTFKRAKKGPSCGGDGYFGAVTVSGSQRGLGSINELEALRQPDTQNPEKYRIRPKVVTHTHKFSGLSLEIANGGEESFADNFTYQTEEGAKDFMKELNQQAHRDGTGRIAQVNGAVSGASTVTFDNGVPTHFREGMYLDIVTSGGTKEADSIELQSVDISNNQITLASNVTVSDDSFIYREDTADNAPTDGKDIAGLKLFTDDGTISATFQNIPRSSVPQWQGIEIDKGGANVSDDMMRQAQIRMHILSGKKFNRINMNPMQQRKYMNIVTPTKEHRSGDTPDTGFKAVPTWDGYPIDLDTDAYFDRIVFYNDAYFKRHDVKAPGFDNTDGKILKWSNGYDAFECYYKYYGNLGTPNPRAFVALDNLAVPTF